jgi:hypothetical protein
LPPKIFGWLTALLIFATRFGKKKSEPPDQEMKDNGLESYRSGGGNVDRDLFFAGTAANGKAGRAESR